MKTIILIFALLFTVSTQVQANELKPINHETSIYSIDPPGIAIMQDACITIAIVDNHNHQGQHAYHATDSRYTASIASSRYSQSEHPYKQTIGSSTDYQVQTSNLISKESWKRNSSGMYMRGAPTSSKDLQGNNGYTATNYNRPEGNHCANYQQTQLFAKGVFLYRDRVRRTDNCAYCREIYKTVVIPENWYRDITQG